MTSLSIMLDLSSLQKKIIAHKTELFFIFLIFLLAFGIRAHLMIYDLLFGYDSYFHARIAFDVAKTFTVPPIDPLAYFQLEKGALLPEIGTFFWYFTAIIFRIFTFFQPVTKEAWIVAVKFFPAIFGALTSVAMYFLGKEAYNKKTGVIMAFFAAVVPAFVYRTMAGFFEEDSLGFLWFVIGLYFFIKSIKNAEFNKNSIINAGLAGIFFTLMAITWGLFLLIPLVLVAWFGSTIILGWFRKLEKEKMINLVKNFAITFLLFAVLTTLFTGPNWIGTTTNYVTQYLPISGENIDRIEHTETESNVYSSSVGEEQKGVDFWGNKYNALIVFPIIMLLFFVPVRLLRKKTDFVTLLMFYWVLITMVMAYVKLKFTFTFGLPIAVAAGVVFAELFSWLGNRPGFEKKLVAFALGFMCLIGVAAGSFFVSQNVPGIEQNTGWKETLYWMEENTPEDSTFFNWWDEGHWTTFIAERKVSADNRNYIFKSNSDGARFMLSQDLNEANEILKEYNPDFILLSEDLLGKAPSLGIYAFNISDRTDPRLRKFVSVAIPCYRNTDALSGKVNVQCGGNNLSEEEYLALPFERIEVPNQVIEQKVRVFIYRNRDATKLFIFNKEMNDTLIVKLFFGIDELDSFEEFYSNKEVRIFKPILG